VGFAREKGARELNHDAGAVTTGPVSVDTTAMGEVPQTLESLLYDAVRRQPAKLGDEAHTAGVALFAPIEPETVIALGRL
jgi:hypothetical protein